MMRGKVLNFGELLLRICPDSEGSWLKENMLPFYVGGAEANVANALALWNVPSAYMSVVPDNFISRQLLGYLNALRIDTSKTIYHGDRIGLYFLDKGKDLKNAGVIYDRNYSAFSELKPGMIDWDEVFKDVSWFHFSAICPALNQFVADVCEEALKTASKKKITISIDLNYRAKLWQYGKQPSEILPNLVQYCDVVMGNIWAAEKMLDIPVSGLLEQDEKSIYLEQALKTSKEIIRQYPRCKSVANTFRFDYKRGVKYYTSLYSGEKLIVSKEYQSEEIVGKVGSGDCFMAGLIYGFYHQQKEEDLLNFATAAAFSKLFIESDFTTATVEGIGKNVQKYELSSDSALNTR